MMDEYISREAVIKKIAEKQDKAMYGIEDVAFYQAIKIIKEEPAADVQPVRRGKWVDERYEDLLQCYSAVCSACGYESIDHYRISDSHNYCENCGADMTGGAENES